MTQRRDFAKSKTPVSVVKGFAPDVDLWHCPVIVKIYTSL